jgi:SpoVK/Ycf46/Vps4 family AAA+-type ATPase
VGFFKVKSKTNLNNIEVGHRIEESDFSTLTDSGEFVQLEYVEEDEKKIEPYYVKPGLWTIIKTMAGLNLQETSFVNDKILESLVQTKDVTDKVECFFRNLHVYAEEGIEVAKRGILLYGQAGGGKTTIINKVANEYVKDGKTAVIVWTTDKFEAYQVKDFIKSFTYEGVEKIILIVEDIGGTEVNAPSAMRSDASLLSLLDNQEKTFSIPTLILATTNFPANFMGNLTNRPQRFDDKIEVNPPNSDAREALLKFFGKGRENDASIKAIRDKKSEGFTPSHIKEVIIRHRIYEKPLELVIKEMQDEVSKYHRGFEKAKASMGIGFDE